MTDAHEFSRPERIDTIGEGARDVTIAADPAERAALARRFGLPSIDSLDATFSLRRDPAGGDIVATGRVRGAVVQSCTVTGEPLAATIDEPVALRFVDEEAADEEIELSADALDTMPIEQGAVDLGEAAAETLALALDPFPRGPAAAATLRQAGVIAEEDAKPLGALAGLAGLRDKLAGR